MSRRRFLANLGLNSPGFVIPAGPEKNKSPLTPVVSGKVFAIQQAPMKAKSFLGRGEMSVQDTHHSFVDNLMDKLKNPLSPIQGRGSYNEQSFLS